MVIQEIFKNEVLMSCLAAFILCQFLKFILSWKRTKRPEPGKLIDTGGMPSSHSGAVSALTMSVFFAEGITTVFAITLVLSLIVIRDAYGLRKEVGEQAKTINRIAFDLKQLKNIHIPKLRELVGHTSTQVTVGILLGISVAVITHMVML